MKKAMMNFGFGSQAYAAPRAEGVALSNEGLLCGSEEKPKGSLETIGTGAGTWGGVDVSENKVESYSVDEVGNW